MALADAIKTVAAYDKAHEMMESGVPWHDVMSALRRDGWGFRQEMSYPRWKAYMVAKLFHDVRDAGPGRTES